MLDDWFCAGIELYSALMIGLGSVLYVIFQRYLYMYQWGTIVTMTCLYFWRPKVYASDIVIVVDHGSSLHVSPCLSICIIPSCCDFQRG